MVEIWAINKLTKEEFFLSFYDTYELAKEDINTGIRLDESDNPDDWDFEILETEWDDEPCDLECGFDPYEGYYTYDC